MKAKTSKYIAAAIIVFGVLFIYFLLSLTAKEYKNNGNIEKYIYYSKPTALFDNIEAYPVDETYINLYGTCIATFNNDNFKINEKSFITKAKKDIQGVPDNIIFFMRGQSKCYLYYYDKYNYNLSFDEISKDLQKKWRVE